MVKATKGVLVNWYQSVSRSIIFRVYSDAAVKEILLQLDSSLHFIIQVLDSNHLFIEESQYDQVQRLLEEKLSENVFKPPQ